MREIDIAKYYCDSIVKELNKIESYNKMIKEAEFQSEEQARSVWDFVDYNIPQGSKQRIKEELKAIRRLTLDLEKKLEERLYE